MTFAAQPETSRTVDRALVLLRAVGDDAPATSSELARRTGLNRTVVHRLLTTLAARGFVRRDGDRYSLGTALVELGGRVQSRLRERARPVLETLAARFGETVVLTVPDGRDAVAIDQVLGGDHLVRVHYAPGFRHPLTKAAHGRAILAYADLPVRDRELQAVLREVRARGWAYSHDELQMGASGLAAPLLDATGRAAGSVGVVAPATRFPDVEEVAAATLAAVAAMED
jgi:IclR family KDG regulon transcriptional repressor